jgi:hypothetical protein
MGTYSLLGTDGGTCQDTRRKRESGGYSKTVERREKNKSGHQEKVREPEHSLAVERRRRDKSGYQEKASEREALTNC